MVVELDAFSGRPNPRWTLSETQAAELGRLMACLSPAAGAASLRSPGLGYRGFRLQGSDGRTYWALRGLVQSGDVLLADPDRRVERFLLEHLPEGVEDVRPWLEGEISDRGTG